MVDVPLVALPEKRALIESLPKDSRRKIFRCGKQHRNYGNTCRWNAWDKVSGEYVIYLDDDDYLADENVFRTLEQVSAPWAIFPVMRCGEFWFHDPPGFCKTGSGMFIYKKELGRYPDTAEYCADGKLVEELTRHPYQAVTDRPLMIYEKRGLGKE